MVRPLFHILRWPNLLMIGLIQYMIYYFLMDAASTQLSVMNFILLALVTMLIGGSGYVINDYYDAAIDAINKPAQRVVGRIWTPNKVLKVYWVVVMIGGLISIFLAVQLHLLPFLFIYPLAVAALWLYSARLKCIPVTGNLWVALFCAGVIAVVALPDILLDQAESISVHLWYYTAFAFLSTWYREVVKDMEDVEGDRKLGCKTLIVRFGQHFGKIFSLLLVLVLVFAVFRWSQIQSDPGMEMALNILQGFIVTSMAFVWWAKDKIYFRMASITIKLMMVLGTIVIILL